MSAIVERSTEVTLYYANPG